jgi:hypothetical protein
MIATGFQDSDDTAAWRWPRLWRRVVLIAPAQVLAPAATTAFEKAKSVEDQLGDSPTVEALRKAARAYEAVVLRYPNSGHCDNALWQEAALFERAFERSAEAAIAPNAAKALEWLVKEYPASRC